MAIFLGAKIEDSRASLLRSLAACSSPFLGLAWNFHDGQAGQAELKRYGWISLMYPINKVDFLSQKSAVTPWEIHILNPKSWRFGEKMIFTFQCFWVIFRHTIPATNNLPLDVGRAPKGKSSCNHWVSVATCSFQGGYSHLHWRSTSLTNMTRHRFSWKKSQLLLGGTIQHGFSRHSWKISSSKNWKITGFCFIHIIY